MKLYVATTLSNAAEAQAIAAEMSKDGWQLSYDWMAHGSVQDGGKDAWTQTAQYERNGVLDADLVVVVMPGGRGTHVELGIALASGKPVLIYGWAEPGNDAAGAWRMSQLEQDGKTCVFYHAPGVVLVDRSRGIDGLRLEALRVVHRVKPWTEALKAAQTAFADESEVEP